MLFEILSQVDMDNTRREYESIYESHSPEAKQIIENLKANYENILNSGIFSDFKIIVKYPEDSEPKIISAHKAVLNHISYFKTIFNNEQYKENENSQLIIIDFEYAVIFEMLRFIYSAKVYHLHLYAVDLLRASEKVSLSIIDMI